MIHITRCVTLVVIVLTAGVSPAFAQVDFSGEWAPRFWEDQPERVPGPELGDYLGIPISDAARLRAESWDASIQTLPEWQCRPHSADYIWRGPSPLRLRRQPRTKVTLPTFADNYSHDALSKWPPPVATTSCSSVRRALARR